MEPTIEQRLAAAKQRIEAARTEKTRLEAQLEAQQAEEQRIVAEMQQLGTDPEKIASEIAALQQQVESGLAKLERLCSGSTVGEAVGA